MTNQTADGTARQATETTKITTGYYTLRINNRPAGHVEKNTETGEWEGYRKGHLVEYGRTMKEAVENMEATHNADLWD